MESMCPRCATPGWDGRSYCEACGLLARGVAENSRLGRSGQLVEEGWLESRSAQATAAAFEGSPRWVAYAEAPPALDLPPGAFPEDSPRAAPHLAVLTNCTILGGSGWQLAPNERCRLVFRPDQLQVFPDMRGWAAEDSAPSTLVDYREITGIEVSGPGTVTRGGGFIGGGFGLSNAAVGMLEASVLNALTTRRKTISVIELSGRAGELFVLHEGTAPKEVRIRLSPVFTKLRSAPTASTAAPAADRLVELSRMVESGLLTREEFEALKAELLRRDA